MVAEDYLDIEVGYVMNIAQDDVVVGANPATAIYGTK